MSDDSKNLTAAQKQWLVANEVPLAAQRGRKRACVRACVRVCVRLCVRGQAVARRIPSCQRAALLQSVPCGTHAACRRQRSLKADLLRQMVEKELGNVVPPSKNTTAAGLVRRFLASKVGAPSVGCALLMHAICFQQACCSVTNACNVFPAGMLQRY
jgi:hypothetical protein